MTDAELRDAAVAELKSTTISYPEWSKRVANGYKGKPYDGTKTSWGRAFSLLAQIAPAVPQFDLVATPGPTSLRDLAAALRPGQIGALREGTYGSASIQHYLTGNSGTVDAPITITAYPGEKPVIAGHFVCDSKFITVRGLTFDGSNTLYANSHCGPNQTLGLGLYGEGVVFENNDYYQSAGKGNALYVSANNVVIRNNTIHDFGGCHHYDHGVYAGTCDAIEVYGNRIWNNPHGWGVQVYPACTNGKFYDNEIDRCGGGFVISDSGSPTCRNNDVYNNTISRSVGLITESGYVIAPAGLSGAGCVPGTNNRFRDNLCIGNPVGAAPNIALSGNVYRAT